MRVQLAQMLAKKQVRHCTAGYLIREYRCIAECTSHTSTAIACAGEVMILDGTPAAHKSTSVSPRNSQNDKHTRMSRRLIRGDNRSHKLSSYTVAKILRSTWLYTPS